MEAELNSLGAKVDGLCSNNSSSSLGFSTSMLNTSNPIFYVIVGFVAAVIILFVVRPKMICIKVEKEGDEKPEYKISYKRAGIAIFVLALLAGGVILGLYFKNKKKNMII